MGFRSISNWRQTATAKPTEAGVVRRFGHDVVLVGQRNFEVALGDFVFSLRKDGNEAQDTLVINAVYIGVHSRIPPRIAPLPRLMALVFRAVLL